MEKQHNLLEIPWIKVIRNDGTAVELSIPEVFENAPDILKIAGETAAQDVAIQRFLMAILHVVVGRYTFDGEQDPLCDLEKEDALKRWGEYWQRREFPVDLIQEYLETYRERFYLIHPETPFYQVTQKDLPVWMQEREEKSTYGASKFCGELLESGNKLRLFPSRIGTAKQQIPYDEAARWLLYLNAFDDASFKTPVKIGFTVAWPGKLGNIYAVGKNLFETLMLNLVLLHNDDPWEEEVPIWEVPVRTLERNVDYLLPYNPSELLTMQSRRILLLWEEDYVVGYRSFGGDQFSEQDAFTEKWTTWRNRPEKGGLSYYIPRKDRDNKQIWREFSAVIGRGENERPPGVVEWITTLKETSRRGDIEELQNFENLQFETLTANYDAQGSSIVDIYTDRLSFHSGLLTAFGEEWITLIQRELDNTNALIKHLGNLAGSVAQASGESSSDGRNARDAARESAYDRMDLPFREWLESLDPEADQSLEERGGAWRETARGIVRELGREIVDQASPVAFVGRMVEGDSKQKDKDGERKKYFVSTPKAYSQFLYYTGRI